MNALSRVASALNAVVVWLAWILSVFAALAVAAIAAILVWSSFQRYVVAHPIPSAEELASFLFVVVAFLAAMEGMVAGRQIRVLPVWAKLPPRLQGWAMIAGHALSIGVLVILIRQTADFALQSYGYGARSYVANLLEWPWMMVIPLALGALALALFARLLTDLEKTLRGEPVPEANEKPAEELA